MLFFYLDANIGTTRGLDSPDAWIFPTITNYALRIMNSIISDARIDGSPYLDAATSPAFP